ncbi:MAG: hypothetical protein KTR16_16155, partial [Acidiferrobacterales bacterium]|nr:hypothetical protein [Acidiferrobacterales bacterium]
SDDEKDKGRKYRSDEKFPDPSELLKTWEKPKFALFITGRQHGYIEPCGCTGLDRQKGGLMRRHSCLEEFKSRGWEMVSIDSGNQIKRFGQQPRIKLRHTYDAMCKVMNYDCIGLGVDDLKTPAIDLLQTMLSLDVQSFTSANVDVMEAGQQKPFLIIQRAGKKIGVINVLAVQYTKQFKVRSIFQIQI